MKYFQFSRNQEAIFINKNTVHSWKTKPCLSRALNLVFNTFQIFSCYYSVFWTIYNYTEYISQDKLFIFLHLLYYKYSVYLHQNCTLPYNKITYKLFLKNYVIHEHIAFIQIFYIFQIRLLSETDLFKIL